MPRDAGQPGLPTVVTERTPLTVIVPKDQSGGKPAPARPTVTPRTAEQQAKLFKLTLYVIASTIAAAGNSITFKLMLNAYRSDDPAHPHDYEFFVNQWNLVLYIGMALAVTCQRRVKYGARWWRKQDVPFPALCTMGFLDAAGSVLSTMGGAYTAGAVQNLLNQVIIPMTLVLSFLFLGQTFTFAQSGGAGIIFVGAAVAVFPSFSGQKGGPNTSSALGIAVFLISVIPAAFSNVYKEHAFSSYHTDLYYLTTCVSAVQVMLGFLFLPLLSIPAFGGLPPSLWYPNMRRGWACFHGINSLPGDDCRNGMSSMFAYVSVNFLYNVLQLLITKHGGATLLVISAALALPVTNLAFKMRFIMGEDTEPFSWYDVVALAIVLLGFLVYSMMDDVLSTKPHKRMPIQFAPGSVIYIRERSNSDPSTPGYTPIRVQPPKRRGSIDEQLTGSRTPTRTTPTNASSSSAQRSSPAIPIGPHMPRRKYSLDASGMGGSHIHPRVLTPHNEEDPETTVSI